MLPRERQFEPESGPSASRSTHTALEQNIRRKLMLSSAECHPHSLTGPRQTHRNRHLEFRLRGFRHPSSISPAPRFVAACCKLTETSRAGSGRHGGFRPGCFCRCAVWLGIEQIVGREKASFTSLVLSFSFHCSISASSSLSPDGPTTKTGFGSAAGSLQ